MKQIYKSATISKDNLRHGNSKTTLNSRFVKNGAVLSD